MTDYVISEEKLRELCDNGDGNALIIRDSVLSRTLSSAIAEHNKAVIQELKTSIKSWNDNLQPSDDYECGIIAGMEVAISLLKGVKDE